MELLAQYGLFLAKITTVVVAIAMTAVIIINLAQRKEQRGELRMTDLSEHHKEMKESLAVTLLDSSQQRQWHKAQKKKQKQEAKTAKARAKLDNVEPEGKPRAWVLDFKGSMDAHKINSLREEITAVLVAAKARNQVAIRLENPGGVVHGCGLAASQLQRLRDRQIPLTMAVDKVTASGGYIIVCAANKIMSAPFAVLGSIDVVAQIPSLHHFLRDRDINIELHTVGQYKRTLTMPGGNTEEGRRKFREDLNETHHLFKDFVHRMHPGLDIERVATGERWYGIQVLERGLVDAVETSDELLLGLMEGHEAIEVRHQQRKKIFGRFAGGVTESADRLLLRWWQHGQKPLT